MFMAVKKHLGTLQKSLRLSSLTSSACKDTFEHKSGFIRSTQRHGHTRANASLQCHCPPHAVRPRHRTSKTRILHTSERHSLPAMPFPSYRHPPTTSQSSQPSTTTTNQAQHLWRERPKHHSSTVCSFADFLLLSISSLYASLIAAMGAPGHASNSIVPNFLLSPTL